MLEKISRCFRKCIEWFVVGGRRRMRQYSTSGSEHCLVFIIKWATNFLFSTALWVISKKQLIIKLPFMMNLWCFFLRFSRDDFSLVNNEWSESEQIVVRPPFAILFSIRKVILPEVVSLMIKINFNEAVYKIEHFSRVQGRSKKRRRGCCMIRALASIWKYNLFPFKLIH